MKRRLHLVLALLLTAVSGAWAQTNNLTQKVGTENIQYTQAELDQQAAEEAIAKINAIGTVAYTDESKEKIDAARAAYDALTTDQKALIDASTLKVLLDAEEVYDDKDAQVKDVEAKIALLDWDALTYTAEWKQKIDDAADAYAALDNDQMEALGFNAEITLAGIYNLYNFLDQQVKNEIADIDAIGEVTYTAECKEKIDAARTYYDEQLSDEQKAAITNYQTLLDAEATYAALKEAATGINNVNANGNANQSADGKYMKDGKLIIVKGGKQYNANGSLIK